MLRATTYSKTTSGAAKPSKQEIRRAEAAIKRQKMLEEQQREKDKVKDRLDLIRQMKGKSCLFASSFSLKVHTAEPFFSGKKPGDNPDVLPPLGVC